MFIESVIRKIMNLKSFILKVDEIIKKIVIIILINNMYFFTLFFNSSFRFNNKKSIIINAILANINKFPLPENI